MNNNRRECGRDNCSSSLLAHLSNKPVAVLCFRGGKIFPEETRGTESESLFHASCYHNQMDDVCAGKDRTYWYDTKTKVEVN